MKDKAVSSTISYQGIAPFRLLWHHRETANSEQMNEFSFTHSHDYYEIYIHIFGDVSFSTNNQVVSLSPGDVVVVKPYDSHRYIYNRPMANNHYVLSLPCGISPSLFAALNELRSPCISPSEEHQMRLISMCNELDTLSRTPNLSEARKLLALSSFLVLLEDCLADPKRVAGQQFPADLTAAMEYIHSHLSDSLSVQDICKHLGFSKDTLSRLFQRHLNISPYAYVQNARLVMAKKCLSEGFSVTDTCTRCGFSDYSHFISRFRKEYGVTPLKFKQRISQDIPTPQVHAIAED